MVRVPLVRVLARDMRPKILNSPSLEVLRVLLDTILARDLPLNVFEESLEMLRGPASYDIGARNAFENFSINLGDVASAASHDIGAKHVIENTLKSTKLWRCYECC